MGLYRGVGTVGDASDNALIEDVTAQATSAQTAATQAQSSATSAQQFANSIKTLTAATGLAGSTASYNSETGVLTVPRGNKGDSGADLTPEVLREKIKQVDGVDSNLDADKLDGKNSTHFLNINSALIGGFF
tara:strand:+ start:793 stop:1188 length:396 start_codon:yes stop_codon:yes gene_type:complete